MHRLRAGRSELTVAAVLEISFSLVAEKEHETENAYRGPDRERKTRHYGRDDRPRPRPWLIFPQTVSGDDLRNREEHRHDQNKNKSHRHDRDDQFRRRVARSVRLTRHYGTDHNRIDQTDHHHEHYIQRRVQPKEKTQ